MAKFVVRSPSELQRACDAQAGATIRVRATPPA
jgi:hypothetical protein